MGSKRGKFTGTLIYVCALMHREAYEGGDYVPAVREFLRVLIILTKLHKWRCTMYSMANLHVKRARTQEAQGEGRLY